MNDNTPDYSHIKQGYYVKAGDGKFKNQTGRVLYITVENRTATIDFHGFPCTMAFDDIKKP